jgi:hypothetical protein
MMQGHTHEWTGGNPNQRRCYCGEMEMLIQDRWERVYLSGNPFGTLQPVRQPMPPVAPDPPKPREWKRNRQLVLEDRAGASNKTEGSESPPPGH